MNNSKENSARTLPVFLVFLAMGFGDVVGPMVGLAKDAFGISHFKAQLLASAGLIMFGVLSVPMGVLQDRKGKKPLLVAGLLIALVGLLIPMFAGMYGPKPQIAAVAVRVGDLAGGEGIGGRGTVDSVNEAERSITIVTEGEGVKKHIVLAPDAAVSINGQSSTLSNVKVNDRVVVTFAATKFFVLLGSIFLLGTGAPILQVVGNPLIRLVSAPGIYSRNLTFAQAIKAIGSSLGFLLPPAAVWAFGLDWPLLFPIYSAILVLTLALNLPLSFPEPRDTGFKPATFGSCFSLLLRDRFVLMMVLGIFVYVGAEICFNAGVPLLVKEKFEIQSFGLLVSWSLFFLPILVGRFAGAAVLKKMAARNFLVLTTILSCCGILLIFTGIKVLAFTGIVIAGLGFANIFPLIFSITIDAMPQRSNEVSGLMVSAIVGGAVLPPIMGLVADKSSLQWSFVVPLVAVAYIVFLAVSNLRNQKVGAPAI